MNKHEAKNNIDSFQKIGYLKILKYAK